MYRRVFTHSYSSTVIEALRRLGGVEVSICVGWPMLDGARAAEKLASHGVEVALYPDSCMLEALRRAEAVVVGCDAALVDGSLVNRSGTWMAAELAGRLGIPLLSLCDSLKLDFGSEWRGEEAEAELGGRRISYPLFDVSDAGLVSGYLSEAGLKAPSEFVEYARRRVFKYWIKAIGRVGSDG